LNQLYADLGRFAELGLIADLTRAVADQGYTQPTPVQMESIPVILDGRDVLAGAQTGTGKTAGFTLPLLQRLMTTMPESGAHAVRALIVTPTRELAAQIEESVRTYGKYLPLRSTVIFGGVGMTPQVDALKEGVDILVATPGRLLDHANEQTVDLSQVEILVLDEADRMLDMGFIHDVKRILALLPQQRQNLLFSATFSDEIRELADGILDNPILIEVARRNAESELVAQRVHPVGQDRKRALLAHLVKTGDWKQVLVFTRTKHGANRLAHQLGRTGISATAIHGNKSQGARTKALADFKAGLVRVLVATDLAARGLDIEELPHVVNYDMPHVAEDYVHRIGRTGRAGSTGEALSLVSPEEQPLLAEVEKLMGRKVEQTVIPGFEPGLAATASETAVDQMPADAQAPQGRQPREQRQPREPRGPREPREQGEPRVGGQQARDPTEPRDGREGREGQGRGRRRNRGRNRNSNGVQRDGQAGGIAAGATDALVAGAVDTPREAQPMPRQGQRPPRDQPRGNRGGDNHRNDRTGNTANAGVSRQEAQREERDNRGNRDTTQRHLRNVMRDDDFGNRIQPLKQPRGIRARIAAGDIDDELDNIGNRMPPQSKHHQHLDSEDEINFNIAPPASQTVFDDNDDQQPASNAGQMFPSSAAFMGDGRPQRNPNGSNRNGRNRGSGAKRNNSSSAGNTGNSGNGNNKRRRGQPQRQQQGQPQRQGQGQGQGQPRQQQSRQQRGGATANGANRQERRR
jgi:ATP-dependent RNA helicase RhlE